MTIILNISILSLYFEDIWEKLKINAANACTLDWISWTWFQPLISIEFLALRMINSDIAIFLEKFTSQTSTSKWRSYFFELCTDNYIYIESAIFLLSETGGTFEKSCFHRNVFTIIWEEVEMPKEIVVRNTLKRLFSYTTFSVKKWRSYFFEIGKTIYTVKKRRHWIFRNKWYIIKKLKSWKDIGLSKPPQAKTLVSSYCAFFSFCFMST